MTPFIPFPSGSLSVSDPVVSITLEAAPVGFTPASYQWQEDAVDIPGETAATLALSDAASNLEGKTYSVEVSYTPTGGVVTTRYYLSSDTWTKPDGLVELFVGCVGAGGGGGSGRRGAAGSTRCGGTGGGGASVVWRRLAAADVTTTVSVGIGSGGGGGAAQTADDNNGASGGAGGDTSFGSYVVAKGGAAGVGGTNAASVAAANAVSINLNTPSYGPYAAQGCIAGSSLSTTAGGPGHSGLAGFTSSSSQISTGCPGGGAGGSMPTANTERLGGVGGGVYDVGSTVAGGAAGTIDGPRNGSAGTDNAANNWMFLTSSALTNGIGTGGGGGASESDGVTAAGNGGMGGRSGAGGGGGGASANGANSGAGGNGAGGLVVVIEVT